MAKLYRASFDRPGAVVMNPPEQKRRTRPRCRHRGDPTRSVGCPTCGAGISLSVFDCSEFGSCTIARRVAGIVGCCEKCPKYES